MDSLTRFRRFLGPVVGSIRGRLNLAELRRALACGASLGSSAFALAMIEALGAHSEAIFTDRLYGSAAVAILGTVADAIRRVGHDEPSADESTTPLPSGPTR